jgi:hypothetical protein
MGQQKTVLRPLRPTRMTLFREGMRLASLGLGPPNFVTALFNHSKNQQSHQQKETEHHIYPFHGFSWPSCLTAFSRSRFDHTPHKIRMKSA